MRNKTKKCGESPNLRTTGLAQNVHTKCDLRSMFFFHFNIYNLKTTAICSSSSLENELARPDVANVTCVLDGSGGESGPRAWRHACCQSKHLRAQRVHQSSGGQQRLGQRVLQQRVCRHTLQVVVPLNVLFCLFGLKKNFFFLNNSLDLNFNICFRPPQRCVHGLVRHSRAELHHSHLAEGPLGPTNPFNPPLLIFFLTAYPGGSWSMSHLTVAER